MRAMVTGGAGFIGSNLQDELVNQGHTVGIVDSLRSGRKENLHPKSQFFHTDVRNEPDLRKAFKKFKPDVIFHLAAQNEVPYSMTHPFEDQEINIVGMINLLKLATEFAVKKVVYSNTGGAYYGDVPEKDLPVSEDQIVLHPTSFYGVSKGTAESYLKLFGNISSLPWVSLRYGNVYGPRQDGNREAGIVAMLSANMLKGERPTINGDGGHTRDYVFVGDVVRANIIAMTYPKSDYFNISTGKRTSNQKVFDTIKAYLKSDLLPIYGPDRKGDTRNNCLSPLKAKKLLHWEPKVEFTDGVALTMDYYLSLKK